MEMKVQRTMFHVKPMNLVDSDNELIEQITSLIIKQKFIAQIIDKDITRSKLEINNSIILMESLIEKVKKDI